MKLNTTVDAVTRRIRDRSQGSRTAYLARLDAATQRKPGADRLGCANVAHAFAALPSNDKLRVVAEKAPNIGIVTAFNDMLSAHAPLQHYPGHCEDRGAPVGCYRAGGGWCAGDV